MRSVKQQSDDIKRLAILAPLLLPLPHKSSHGMSQLVSIVRFYPTDKLDGIPFSTSNSYSTILFIPTKLCQLQQEKRNHKLPYDGGNVVSYHKHNVQGWSAAIVHYHTRVLSQKLTTSEYSKISIQLASWAEISFFDLKLLLNFTATLEARTKDQSLTNCTSQQVADNIRRSCQRWTVMSKLEKQLYGTCMPAKNVVHRIMRTERMCGEIYTQVDC